MATGKGKEMDKDQALKIEHSLWECIDSRFFALEDAERGEYQDTEKDLAFYEAFSAVQKLRMFLADEASGT